MGSWQIHISAAKCLSHTIECGRILEQGPPLQKRKRKRRHVSGCVRESLRLPSATESESGKQEAFLQQHAFRASWSTRQLEISRKPFHRTVAHVFPCPTKLCTDQIIHIVHYLNPLVIANETAHSPDALDKSSIFFQQLRDFRKPQVVCGAVQEPWIRRLESQTAA
jgi:hypothetical protein